MKKERLAQYTVILPITFQFKARADVDEKVLHKMAQSYAELILRGVQVEYDSDEAEIMSQDVIYSFAEKVRMSRELDEAKKEIGF